MIKKENIIQLPKDINSVERNYSTRFYQKYRNNKRKEKETELKNEKNEKEKIVQKEKDIHKIFEKKDDNISNKKGNQNKNNNSKQIDLFTFTIKERERKVIRVIKSHVNLFQNEINKNENTSNTERKNIEVKTRINNDEAKNKISFFCRYKNNNLKTLTNTKIINKQKEKNEEKSSKNLDENQKFNVKKANNNINQINNNKNNNKNNEKLVQNKQNEKVSEIQLKRNYKINENQKYQQSPRKKNKLNENELDNNMKNSYKNKEALGEKKRNIETNLSPKKQSNNNNNYPKFQIKNYLIKNSNEKSKHLKTDNDKNEKKLISENKMNKPMIINSIKITENKHNIDKKKEEEKNTIISVSRRLDNNQNLKSPLPSKPKQYSNFEVKNPLINSSVKKSRNHVVILDKNSNNTNISLTNSSSKQRIKNYLFPNKQKVENNIVTKRERIKDYSMPKKIIRPNKPPDIIEPEDIDTNKDFPIDDPYLKTHPDLYEEIQGKLKEIMYKHKLPIFNPELYKVEKKIGEGTHGSIYQVVNSKTGKKYAIKKIFSNDIILLKYIKKEFELVYDAVHPNILGIYGIYIKCFDSSLFSLSVLMDLGETDWEIEINRHLKENKYYTENQLMSILKQLISGLVYLQKEKKIAHRDIKPENVIVFKNDIYKLGDFGEAKGTKNADKLSTLRGTDTYMSPILYNGLKMAQEDIIHDIYRSDVFSLGYSILYAVSLNHDIINEIRELENMDEITKILKKRMKPRYSDNFINIILRMINPEEGKRVDFIALSKLVNNSK